MMVADDFNGIVLGTFMKFDKHLRGLALSLILMDGKGASIDGVVLAGFAVRAKSLRGVSIGFFGNPIREVKGVVFGAFNFNDSVTGIQIGLLNSAKQLNGIQLGLLNYAGNNAYPFQHLPLINMHFSF